MTAKLHPSQSLKSSACAYAYTSRKNECIHLKISYEIHRVFPRSAFLTSHRDETRNVDWLETPNKKMRCAFRNDARHDLYERKRQAGINLHRTQKRILTSIFSRKRPNPIAYFQPTSPNTQQCDQNPHVHFETGAFIYKSRQESLRNTARSTSFG